MRCYIWYDRNYHHRKSHSFNGSLQLQNFLITDSHMEWKFVFLLETSSRHSEILFIYVWEGGERIGQHYFAKKFFLFFFMYLNWWFLHQRHANMIKVLWKMYSLAIRRILQTPRSYRCRPVWMQRKIVILLWRDMLFRILHDFIDLTWIADASSCAHIFLSFQLWQIFNLWIRCM